MIEAKTATAAGLSQEEQMKVVLKTIIEEGGCAQMKDIYDAMNSRLKTAGSILSEQGHHSLRRLVNSTAVSAGFVYPHDRHSPGWRVTPEGRQFLDWYVVDAPPTETVVDSETQQEINIPSNVILGSQFEIYCIDLLKQVFPHYAWFHQGRFKRNERGLDIIGDRIGLTEKDPRSIGVQVKLYQERSVPTDKDWRNFLAGCFVRKIDKAVLLQPDGFPASSGVKQVKARYWSSKGEVKSTELPTCITSDILFFHLRTTRTI